MIHLGKAILELIPNAQFSYVNEDYSTLKWDTPDIPQPTEEEIQDKIAELEAVEPLRLLRIERTRLLNETDWEMTRILETSTKTSTAYKNLNTYREALRNLPQEIEAGNIEAPTLDETGNLVFTGWPERVTE